MGKSHSHPKVYLNGHKDPFLTTILLDYDNPNKQISYETNKIFQ